LVSPPTFVVHGHFYQPPRENPWTEEVPRELSAAPFHDWNERIAAECYRPNAFARVIDGTGQVLDIVNNYALMSFNIGPTLMSWLERFQPAVYDRIRAAHAQAGAGIAQAYNHMILPLASERDARTQIRWGLADFRHRFGAGPAGLWLPETAVNEGTMALLAEEGVGFTILAPGQAAAIRPLPGAVSPGPAAVPNPEWQPVTAETIDTRLAYRWVHPDHPHLGVDVVVYHGNLSHDLAFSSMSSEAMIDRVTAAADRRGGLVTAALDGETFGHHQKWMDRGLAYALTTEGPRRGVKVTNLATWLRANRPTRQIQVHESAWSCAHGVGRWSTDCGCSTGGAPGTNQQWRAPLRAALDLLRDFGVEVFERRGAELFTDDPWRVRDAYIDVLLGAVSPDDFAARWIAGDRVAAFIALEAQRNAMLMYTSCGWFFHDLAGLETVQVMRYAARTMDLLEQLGEAVPRGEFDKILATAQSFSEGDGTEVWAAHVTPARVDAHRIAAHLVLTDLFELGEAGAPLGAWTDMPATHDRLEGRATSPDGGMTLAWRSVFIEHRRTGRRWSLLAIGLRYGENDASGVVVDHPAGNAAVESVRHAVESDAGIDSIMGVMRAAAGAGPAVEFDLGALLPEAAEALLTRATTGLASGLAAGAEAVLDALHWVELSRPPGATEPVALPETTRNLAMTAVKARMAEHLQAGDTEAAAALAHRARKVGLPLDCTGRSTVGAAASRLATAAVSAALEDPGQLPRALAVVALARDLCPEPDLDAAVEAVFGTATASASPRRDLLPLGEALGLAPQLFTTPRRDAGAA
jgi:alpha-amylase/alpha-mannosidase (GH57 family)